jgi:hypothetical protein
MYRKLIISLLLTLAGTVSAENPSDPQIIAKPIPPGYHFPTPQAVIDKWIADSNTIAIRRHAWDIWAGMTTNSGEFYEDQELPIWETWYGSDEVFQVQPAADQTAAKVTSFLASHRKSLRAFIPPHQFTKLKLGLKLSQVLGPPSTRLLSFNKFNPQAAAFIATPQAGPNGQTYYYNSGDSLRKLNNAWPIETPAEDRGINSFPNDAIELKPLFNIVHEKGLTAIPVWRGPAASTRPENPSPETWTTCALVDPKGTSQQIRPATEQEIANADKGQETSCKNYFYASMATLYSIKLTNEEAAAFNRSRNGGVTTHDFAVLIALHVISRETTFWTWQSFYWQPGADTPNGFPGSKAGQPKTLKAPWTNYAVTVGYSQTTKPGGTQMNISFNPYVELNLGIPDSLSSNCMSCHGTARIVANPEDVSFPLDYNAPIAFFTDPIYFNKGSTNTAFSWAIVGAAVTSGN